MHNAQHHISFSQDIRDIHMTGMRASMDDSIHIQVQVVKLWQQSRIRNNLIDFRVALTDPSIKLKKKSERVGQFEH
jgi:hypothetical protein